jgi:hypothetical protein
MRGKPRAVVDSLDRLLSFVGEVGPSDGADGPAEYPSSALFGADGKETCEDEAEFEADGVLASDFMSIVRRSCVERTLSTASWIVSFKYNRLK